MFGVCGCTIPGLPNAAAGEGSALGEPGVGCCPVAARPLNHQHELRLPSLPDTAPEAKLPQVRLTDVRD